MPGWARWSAHWSRPFGGWLSDKMGGARVTFWNFVVMALAVVGVLYFLPQRRPSGGSFYGFLAMFMCFRHGDRPGQRVHLSHDSRDLHERAPGSRQAQARGRRGQEGGRARREQGGRRHVLGFTSAVGAYGGFFIPKKRWNVHRG